LLPARVLLHRSEPYLSRVAPLHQWWRWRREGGLGADHEMLLARVTGLEPATSDVTGRRSDQLSYTRSGKGQALGPAAGSVKAAAWLQRRGDAALGRFQGMGGDGLEPPTLSV
jgi:hypothetical protein